MDLVTSKLLYASLFMLSCEVSQETWVFDTINIFFYSGVFGLTRDCINIWGLFMRYTESVDLRETENEVMEG